MPLRWRDDVILSDVHMPAGNGIEFMQALIDKGCRHPELAMMSGNWSEADIERVTRLGCKVFRRPFPMSQVSQWLDGVEKKVSPQRQLFDWPRC